MSEADQISQMYYNSGYEQGVIDAKEKIMAVINEPVTITVRSIHTNVIRGVIHKYKHKIKERIESDLSALIVDKTIVKPPKREFINVFPYTDGVGRKFKQLDMGTRQILD